MGQNTANTAGTPFDDVSASSLPSLSATDAIKKNSVPNFTTMWGTDDNAVVAVIQYGAGYVIFMGWDFFNSGPGCLQYSHPWVQEVIPAALDYATELSDGSVDNISYTSADLTYSFSQSGQSYYVVVEDGSTPPTEAQIKAGVDYTGVTIADADEASTTASTDFIFNMSGLDYNTAYIVYVVTEYDNEGVTTFSQISDFNFTTLANDTPTISTIEDLSFCVGDSFTPINFTVSDEFPETPLTVVATSSNTALIQDSDLTISNTGSDYQLTYAFIDEATGSTDITISATDGEGATTTEVFSITLNFLNISLENEAYILEFNQPMTPIEVIENSSNSTTYSITPSLPTGLSLDASTGTISGTPTVSFPTPTGFTITGTTTAGCSDTVNLSIGVNSKPEIDPVSDITENCPNTDAVVDVTISDNETSADDLIVSASSSNTSLLNTFDISSTGATRTLTLTPEFDQTGTATVTVTVEDEYGFTTQTSFDVTFIDENAPTAIAQNLTVELDETGSASITAAEVDNGSSDNCGVETLALDVTSFDCADLGENFVTLTVTDTSGNEATAIATVTVVDNSLPTAIAQNLTVELDETGSASITAAEVDNGSSDNCGLFDALIYGFTNDYAIQNSSGTSALGFNIGFVSMNAANDPISFEPVSQVDQFLRIGDVIRIKYRKAGSAQNKNVQWRGNSNSLGDVTWESSNFRTAFSIEQEGKTTGDLFDPTEPFFMKSEFSVLGTSKYLNSSSGVTMADIPEAWSLDIISGYFPGFSFSNTSTETQIDFDCSNVGTNSITLYATDSSGNQATATATVTVVDNSSPTAIAQNLTVELDETGSASITAAEVDNGSSDNCGVETLALDVTNFDCSNLGENFVILTVTDSSGNQATATATVTVVDNSSPTAIAQNLTVELDETGSASITAAEIDNGSTDNCGVETLALDVTSFDCSNLGENFVILTVTDSSGNQATATATVTVVDNSLPTAIAQNLTIELDESGSSSITAAEIDNGSTDNCGVETLALDVTNFDCSNLGENFVILTVTDSSGNQSTATATVTVVDNSAPTAIAQNLTIELDETGSSSITAAEIDNGSTDNCGVETLALDVTNFDCSNLGENFVTLTVTDTSGNEATATATVTVVDNSLPTAIAQNLTVELDETGSASITAAEVDNGSSDNCGIETLALDVTSFDCSNLGENFVILTVTDSSGNQATATATVTVVDNSLPTAIAQNLTVELDETGSASITAAEIDNGSSDNCGVETLALDVTSFDCSNLGENFVILTVTDSSGNQATATATVTVVDNSLPTAIAQNLTVELDETGSASIIAAKVDNGSSDNCGIETLALDVTSFDCSSLGENSVILTVTDSSGNEATATAVVTVVDDLSPSLEATGITVSLDSNDTVTILPVDLLVIVFDNCTVEEDITLSLDEDTFTMVGEYEVNLTATDAAGNSTTVAVIVIVDETLGVRDIGLDLDIKLYPNPTSGYITIVGSSFKLEKVTIYDMSGRLVTTSKEVTIDVSDLSTGIYFAKVDGNDGKHSQMIKFVKK